MTDETAWVLAERHETTEQTVWKLRKRDTVEDRSHKPHRLQTTLTPLQEAAVVPLSKSAIALLEALPRMADCDLVFPPSRNGMMSDMSISAVMRRIQAGEEKAGKSGFIDQRSKRPAVPHGLRSSFRDWAAERTDYPREMAELALAHSVGNAVEQAYRRSDMLERRREMMEEWAGFVLRS